MGPEQPAISSSTRIGIAGTRPSFPSLAVLGLELGLAAMPEIVLIKSKWQALK